jgi:hypothetical protein
MFFDTSNHHRDFTGSLVIANPIRHQKPTLCHHGSAGTSEYTPACLCERR